MTMQRTLRSLLAAATMLGSSLLPHSSAKAQWMQSPETEGRVVTGFALNGATLFIATSDSGVYRSTDNGNSWAAAKTGLPRDLLAITSTGTSLFAGRDAGIYRSTNNGDAWSPVNTGLTNPTVYSLLATGTTVFAGTAGSGVFRSTDNGANWGAANTGMPTATVQCLAGSNANLFAGTKAGGVYRSTDNGSNWTPMNGSLMTLNVLALCVVGSDIYAGTSGGGVFRSTNNGANWTVASTGLTSTSVYSFAADGGNLFAGTTPGGFSNLFVSTGGGSWSSVSGTLPVTAVYAMTVAGAYLVAGTTARGVWRRPLSEVTTVPDEVDQSIPQQLTLDQNFPNPFNPTTTIRFTIGGVVPPSGIHPERSEGGPTAARVRLSVYDLLGREVAVLVNEAKAPGYYTVRFDATGLASGMYLYRLTAGDFAETRTLLLLK